TAVGNARNCSAIVDPTIIQCAVAAYQKLSCGGGCRLWVNSDKLLVDIKAKWEAQGCAMCPQRNCTKILCPVLNGKHGDCTSTGGPVVAPAVVAPPRPTYQCTNPQILQPL